MNHDMLAAPSLRPWAGRWSGPGALAAIVGIGLALRVWGLGAESVWWDEYTSLMHLDASDLWSFLKLNRTLDPATLPLYYTIEYLWSHWVSDSVLGLRLVSVFLGMLSVPLLYLLGKALHGRTAGLVAALCLSLSPIHAFHAQGIRMYVLLNLLALCSAYSFVRVMRDGGRRWWTLHAASNLLLMWTHPFALLILAVEGCFLTVFRFRQVARLAAWVGLQILLLVPSAAYLFTVRFWSTEQTGTWLTLPTPLRFLGDLIADDVIAMTYQLRVSDAAWSFLPDGLARVAVGMHPWFDAALALLPCLAVAWLARRAYSRMEAARAAERRHAAENLGFLLLWLLLPPVALYAASIAWRPCIFPRYTVYSSLACYLIVGGAVASLRRNGAKVVATCGVALLLGYQASLVHPGPQRTDWKSAAHIINTEGDPNDLILVQVSIWKDVFQFNLGPTPHPVASAERLEVLADETAFFLDLCRRSEDLEDRARRAWALIKLPYFDSGPSLEFEKRLTAHKLDYTLSELGGIQRLLVYRITGGPCALGARGAATTAAMPMHDYVQGYGNLAMALGAKREYATAQAALREVFEADPGAGRTYGVLLDALKNQANVAEASAAVRAVLKGHGHRENGQFRAAAREFRKAAEVVPDYATAHAELGLMLAQMGDHDAARDALDTAFELEPDYKRVYASRLKAIERGGDVAAATAAVVARVKGNELREAGQLDAAIVELRKATELDPGYVIAFAELGMALAENRACDEALAALRRAVELEPAYANTCERMMGALERKENAALLVAAVRTRTEGNELLATGRLDDAAAAFLKATKLDPEFALAFSDLGMILAEAGDYAGALSALRRAIALDSNNALTFEPLVVALERGENIEAVAAATGALVQGRDFVSSGFLEEGIERFRRATGLCPHFARPFAELGTALIGVGDRQDGKAALERAIQLEPANASIYTGLVDAVSRGEGVEAAAAAVRLVLEGFGLKAKGRLDAAITAMREAAELDPNCSSAWHGLGTMLIEKGDYDGALPVMQKVVAASPSDALLYGHVTKVIEQKGDVGKALAAMNTLLTGIQRGEDGDSEGMTSAFREAVRIDETFALGHAALGTALLSAGDEAGCARAMRKAFELDRDLAAYWEPFFVALFETKDYDKAWAEVARLKEMDAELPEPLVRKLERDSGQRRREALQGHRFP